MLLTFLKLFTMLFPFVKELFLGTDLTKKKRIKGSWWVTYQLALRRILVCVGLGSFVGCLFLGKQLWVVSSNYRELKESPPVHIAQSSPSPPLPPPNPPLPPMPADRPPSVTSNTPLRPKRNLTPAPTNADVTYHLMVIQKLSEIEKCKQCD
jgi:hypothetical protein